MRSMNWSSHFVDDTDSLVHFASESVPLPGQRNTPYPAIAYTRCGIMVTYDGEAYVNAGKYVDPAVMLTCVKCLGGARDGHIRRKGDKAALFGVLYGRPTRNDMADHSITVLQAYAKDDVEMTLRLMWPRAVLRRCSRLSKVLFAKATEGRDG